MIIYKKEDSSISSHDFRISYKGDVNYLGIIYHFVNIYDLENFGGYVGQSSEGITLYAEFIDTPRPRAFLATSKNFKYAGEKVNKARKELSRVGWKFEVLAVVNSRTEGDLQNELNKLETQYIIKLDSVDSGYNSNYGGKYGYKHKWMCERTLLPTLKELGLNKFAGWKTTETTNERSKAVLVSKEQLLKGEDLWINGFKTQKICELPDSVKKVIYEKQLAIVEDDSWYYLPEDQFWYLFSENFYVTQDGKRIGGLKYEVILSFDYEDKDRIDPHKSVFWKENSIRDHRKCCIYVEKLEDHSYKIIKFESFREAAKFTKREYSSVLFAAKRGIGGFLQISNCDFNRHVYGQKFLIELVA